jgi:hypothetical protein
MVTKSVWSCSKEVSSGQVAYVYRCLSHLQTGTRGREMAIQSP